MKRQITFEQLKKLIKESGMTIEDAFDQMEQDVRKAKYAYLKGEVEEASGTVFEIIEDAKGISNRLTETTGGPLMESTDKSDVNDEAVQLAMEFAKVMDEVPNGIYNAIQSDDVANGKNCLAVVRGLLYAARECRDAFGSGKEVKGLDDFIISAQLFIDHWEDKLAPYLDVPFESKQHNKRK